MTKLINVYINGKIWSAMLDGDKVIPLRELGAPGYRLLEKKAS